MMSMIAVDASITASILHIAISAYQLILALFVFATRRASGVSHAGPLEKPPCRSCDGRPPGRRCTQRAARGAMSRSPFGLWRRVTLSDSCLNGMDVVVAPIRQRDVVRETRQQLVWLQFGCGVRGTVIESSESCCSMCAAIALQAPQIS